MLHTIAEKIVNAIIRRAKKTPHYHIYSSDGSLYMERFNLFKRDWFWIRVHHIARPDLDRAMHDHPWNFVSWVMRGSYLEARPVKTSPCFVVDGGDSEYNTAAYRNTYSLAYRRATDRHKITWVESGTWTLVFIGPKIQWWGFYTRAGKIYYKEYRAENGTDRNNVAEESHN